MVFHLRCTTWDKIDGVNDVSYDAEYKDEKEGDCRKSKWSDTEFDVSVTYKVPDNIKMYALQEDFAVKCAVISALVL